MRGRHGSVIKSISIHAPRTGSDAASIRFLVDGTVFQSTLPARGATRSSLCCSFHCLISIHAPRTGSDWRCWEKEPTREDFNPRSPHGERPGTGGKSNTPTHFNPRSPHGERRLTLQSYKIHQSISIHAPRTGSDFGLKQMQACQRDFNPRSPHGERLSCGFLTFFNEKFQSTLPARGATGGDDRPGRRELHFNPRSPHGERQRTKKQRRRAKHFNPRSPHGERRQRTIFKCRTLRISIHAPRTGSDSLARMMQRTKTHFNPRSPHGERPRVGIPTCNTDNFNPRSPHGERLFHLHLLAALQIFQSTLPARGATGAPYITNGRAFSISIHAPRTGSDTERLMCAPIYCETFQSTLPARGATFHSHVLRAHDSKFQSTLPARGATRELIDALSVG